MDNPHSPDMNSNRNCRYFVRRGATRAVRSILIVTFAGFIGATLIRYSPGFGLDEEALDPRLSRNTLEARSREHEGQRDIVAFYAMFWRKLISGDLGTSEVFGQPVAKLLEERVPATAVNLAGGLLAGWGPAILLAIWAAFGGRVTARSISGTAALLVCMPSALIAIVVVLFQLPAFTAVGAVVFPRAYAHVFEHVRAELRTAHVLAARARGTTLRDLAVNHLGCNLFGPIIAAAGATAVVALGACIPIEALTDTPGIGQMVWRAALGRDLPVLVIITILMTVVAVIANAAADLLADDPHREPA